MPSKPHIVEVIDTPKTGIFQIEIDIFRFHVKFCCVAPFRNSHLHKCFTLSLEHDGTSPANRWAPTVPQPWHGIKPGASAVHDGCAMNLCCKQPQMFPSITPFLLICCAPLPSFTQASMSPGARRNRVQHPPDSRHVQRNDRHDQASENRKIYVWIWICANVDDYIWMYF